MSHKLALSLSCLLLLVFGAVRPASAQWAVIDVAAIAQAIEEYITLQEQLTTIRDHLDQAREQYAALTGTRGMERLLAGTTRNYLPTQYEDLSQVISGAAGAFGALSSEVRRFVDVNAILTPEDLARLSPEEREHLDAMRRSAATLQVLTAEALAATSGRFQSIQVLIDAIPSAQDPKAIADLQARIAGEEGHLANENSKLEALYQAMQAEEAAQRLKRKERGIADTGSLRDLPPLVLARPEAFP